MGNFIGVNGQRPSEIAVCARCGTPVAPADHFRVSSADGTAEAVFCRSEHIVAWVLRGAQWQTDRPWEVPPVQRAAQGPLLLERVRADERIERRFKDTEELRRWSSDGGFWGER